MNRLLPDRAGLVLAFALLGVLAAVEFAWGRPLICTCGYVELWHGKVQSSGNSQHIADWYSFSHVIHGLLFYFFAWVLFVRGPAILTDDLAGAVAPTNQSRTRRIAGSAQKYALAIAVAFEGFWELLENSPVIIDRYRAVTVSYGYSGDSIVNSVSDVGFMMLGFWVAAKLPPWASVALAVAFELFTLAMIRDNLTLNVLMLVWPVEAIRQWQAGG